MQRCKVKWRTTFNVEFKLQAGEEETAEELIELLEAGSAPAWLEALFVNKLERVLSEGIEVDDFTITGSEPSPDEELIFDY